jgi:hypothetical protein
MKFTRRQKIEALRIAKNKIKRHTHAFICVALPETHVGYYLRDYIVRQFGSDITTLNTWCRANRPELPTGPSDMRTYRVQWLDWMIENAQDDE